MSTRAKKKETKSDELEVEDSVANLGSLQHDVLTNVSHKNFDDAVKALNDYQVKKQYYPGYAKRTARLFTHAVDLVGAIKSVKGIPNYAALSPNKQEELTNKSREHWEELKVCLRRLKTIEKDLDLEDARSTVWVLKAFAIAAMLILFTFVFREAMRSMGQPTKVLLDQLSELVWERIL